MNNSYHIIRIQRYLNGELGRDEMYEIEREALDDPLLQDAIDGYRLQKDVSHRQLSLLQQRLAARIAGQAKERNAFYFGWQRLGVAATACVLMVLVLVLLWMRNHPETKPATEKEVQVTLATPQNGSKIRAVVADGAVTNAQPEGGWDTFNAYLAGGKRDVATTGNITVTFDIDAQGKPTAIQGVGPVDGHLFVEAKRLLEQGPAWIGTKAKMVILFE